ncbi:Hypothetical predicted protein [Paramuricea clavata]|uniref:Uncharacterized protein n=1 Tax=Paramuricea clavata TaxID=317549 RepID=A0A6S7J065_PARCT|nr:Hypothetical predicted protein [Paramuricea clavata]
MERISSLKVLDDDQENHKMISKLPSLAAVRWGRLKADIASDPVNVRKISKDDDSKVTKKSRNTLLTKSKDDDPNDHETTKDEGPAVNSCILCKGAHKLNSCQEFCKKDVKERKEFTKSQGLCFGCLKQGHVSKYCTKRKTCDTFYVSFDASASGYGQCSYIHLVNVHKEVHCELVMAKSCVSPLKTITIPCLKLTAALVSVRVSTMLHKIREKQRKPSRRIL